MGTHSFIRARPEVALAKFLGAMTLFVVFLAVEKLFILWLLVFAIGIVVLVLFAALPLSLMAGVGLISPLVALTDPLLASPYATWTPQYGWVAIGAALAAVGGFLAWLSSELGDEDDNLEPPTPVLRYHHGPRP